MRRFSLLEPDPGAVARNAMGLGALLTILGLGTFALLGFAPDGLSALTPSVVGVLFLAVGYSAACRPRHQRRIAYGLGILAVMGMVVLLPGAWQLFSGRSAAVSVEHATAVLLCGFFLVQLIVWLARQGAVPEG